MIDQIMNVVDLVYSRTVRSVRIRTNSDFLKIQLNSDLFEATRTKIKSVGKSLSAKYHKNKRFKS